LKIHTKLYPDQAKRLANAFFLVLAILALAIVLNVVNYVRQTGDQVLGISIDCNNEANC